MRYFPTNAPGYTPPAIEIPHLGLRQVTSILTAILLYTAATPFTPAAWLLNGLDGAFLLDRFISGLALLCAMYFQYRLSCITHPIAISSPVARTSAQYVQNGRMGGRKENANGNGNGNGNDDGILFVYYPRDFFKVCGVEVLGLLFAEFGGFEVARRVVVVGVVAALWVVGWEVTPESTKRWAWGHIKTFWFFVVFDVLWSTTSGGGRRTARPGRRY